MLKKEHLDYKKKDSLLSAAAFETLSHSGYPTWKCKTDGVMEYDLLTV